MWKAPATLTAVCAPGSVRFYRILRQHVFPGREVEVQVQRAPLASCVSIMARCWSSRDNIRAWRDPDPEYAWRDPDPERREKWAQVTAAATIPERPPG